ncbi:MAG: cell wall metabolism sensor histidine kinase WalK [Clostridiales bacterium]|nr:cell wall metabolism sensor histidine kinase WalK [Clostridiales bacterium]
MLLYILLVVFVIVVSGVYIIMSVQRNQYRDTYTELEYTSDRIVDTLQTASLEEESDIQAVFAEVLSALMLESVNLDAKNIYLLDQNGDMIYYRDAALTQADLASRAIMDAMDGRKNDELYVHRVNENDQGVSVGDYARSFDLRYRSSGTDSTYILFIRQTLTEVENTVYNTMMIIITASVVAILVAGVLAYFLAGTISNPLRRLTRKTQEMAKGNLEAAAQETVAMGNNDELTELESNFAYMGRELSNMLREVNNEKNKLSTVFSYMADGLVVYDTEGKLVQSNPAAARLLGDRILYEDFDKIFAPFTIQELLESEEKTHTQLMQVDDAYINAIFVEYMEEEGVVAGLIVVLQDTTEAKQMEEMQKEFVANVSHELRTPITTIKSYVETLIDGAKDEPEVEDQFLGVINHESDRMTHLISELLELSRIDSRQVKLQLEPVDLTDLVKNSVDEHVFLAQQKEQTLSFVGPEQPHYIEADTQRVEQVLRNLITNAIKYSPKKASITLGMRPQPRTGRVEVFVRDTGMGIEKKEQERIFERFYRVDKARSRSMGGTGLGLAISREIMEMHHGEIWVESQYGKGSTFWLSFPLMDQKEETA